jgi:uncharacterized caspase-like protein
MKYRFQNFKWINIIRISNFNFQIPLNGGFMKSFIRMILIFIICTQYIYSQDATGRSQAGSLEKPPFNLSLPKIWAVVIGVSKYKYSDMDLKYADKDAQFYYDYLTSPSGGNVAKENSVLLLNEKATRENILKEINDKCNRSFEDDLLIIYIAGHGMPDPVGNEIYFLSYESKPDNLAGTAVSQIDIEKALARSRAKKKVWIADACHSGGAGLNTNVRGDRAYLINRMLFEIANAKEGLAVLAASSASEYSKEGDEWGKGHGVFTYYLIDALKGSADIDKDGIITIREVFEYVYNKVNDATKGQQHPVLQGTFDNRLPMGVIK